MKYEIICEYTDSDFRSVTGVTPKTFSVMLAHVKSAYAEAHRRRGRHRKLSQEDMLLMTLEYYKEYRTLECMGASYGLRKSSVGKTIRWVEKVLVDSGTFSLPSKKRLSDPGCEIEVVVVDTTETPIQRPSKGQKHFYSGKKSGTR